MEAFLTKVMWLVFGLPLALFLLALLALIPLVIVLEGRSRRTRQALRYAARELGLTVTGGVLTSLRAVGRIDGVLVELRRRGSLRSRSVTGWVTEIVLDGLPAEVTLPGHEAAVFRRGRLTVTERTPVESGPELLAQTQSVLAAAAMADPNDVRDGLSPVAPRRGRLSESR